MNKVRYPRRCARTGSSAHQEPTAVSRSVLRARSALPFGGRLQRRQRTQRPSSAPCSPWSDPGYSTLASLSPPSPSLLRGDPSSGPISPLEIQPRLRPPALRRLWSSVSLCILRGPTTGDGAAGVKQDDGHTSSHRPSEPPGPRPGRHPTAFSFN